MVFRYAPPAQRPLVLKAIADLEQAIAQDALDKKADNARELGLSYDDEPAQPSCPECVFGMCHCGAAGGQKQPAPEEDLVDLAVKADNWGQP